MKKFTLIELMIVIATFGIILSLLLPSLSRARKTAEIAVCMNNLRQIAAATSMYLKDADYFFPGYFVHGGYANGYAYKGNPQVSYVGKKGKFMGNAKDPKYRAANPYLGTFSGDDEVSVAHCPLDNKKLRDGVLCHSGGLSPGRQKLEEMERDF